MTAVAAYESLVGKLLEANQGHLVTFWASLSPREQDNLLAELRALDLRRISSIFKLATTTTPSPPSTISPLPVDLIASTVDGRSEDLAAWETKGFHLIAQGKVAVVLMAGGQGTRLGSSAPKGAYDIGLPSHKSLFALQADRIRRVQALAGTHALEGEETAPTIPWYIMTSAPTRAATEAHFVENAYFGMRPDDVFFFNQGTLPCFDPEGKIFLASPSSLTSSPDGNGGIYAALASEGVLEDMTRRGIEHIHSYCVDNSLVRVADPTFLGYCALQNAECGAKVVRKTLPEEPVGVLCKREGKYAVVEYSEIDKAMSEERREDGRLAYGAANIANHYYTLDFLRRVGEFESSLAYHVANKKIAHVDTTSGDLVKPTSPNGIKLELFVFDVFPHTERLAVLEVDREEEFSPLKNAPGAGVDCPETSKAAILGQQRRWLEAVNATVEGDGDVEVSGLLSYKGEGLESLASTTQVGPKVITGL